MYIYIYTYICIYIYVYIYIIGFLNHNLFQSLSKLVMLMYMCFKRNVFNSIFSVNGEVDSWIFDGRTQKGETNVG